MNHKSKSWLSLIAMTGSLVQGGPAASLLAQTTRVPLVLAERAGAERRNEPVTSGVPIPKGELKSVENVRLVHDGKEVPAQFRAVGCWRPAESIRWLLVDCQADIGANQRQQYVLEYGGAATAAVRPLAAIRVQESNEGFTVDTGAATFRLSKTVFSLFEEVRLADGSVVVTKPAKDKPRYGAEVRGIRSMVTRAIPAPANQGRSHLIYVRCSEKCGQEDYTLRFTSDQEYEVTGGKSGPVGKGAYQKSFVGRGDSITIPADAWLAYAHPKQGDVYTFRSAPEGSAAVSEGVFETAVVERGPLRTVIRVKGALGPAMAPVLEYTAWYHFFAGSGRVKLAFTLENNAHGGRTPDGNARNADIGGINTVFFKEMVLELPVSLAGKAKVCVGGSAEQPPVVAELGSPVELYQDSSGGAHWDCYRDAKFHPRPNSYVTFKGYRIFADAKEVGQGDRALGWLDVANDRGGVTIGVQDFWQNFPKALTAQPNGEVAIGLFPGRYAGDFSFRSGEHKTHEVWFDFHPGPAAKDDNVEVARAFSDPLRLEPSPEWFAKTQALGDLHPFDKEHYAAYEVRNLSTIGIFPENATDRQSLLSRIEEHNFYGWMDYGDVPIDFESPSGQWGMKYDMDYHLAQQYTRTLDPRWWSLFVAADKHTRDIDVHHQPHYPGLHFVKGGVWAHSTHNEPGHKNPHRNYNHFTKDLAFGARGTATLYYLTGDWKAHDACLEIAENALAEYMSPQADPGAAAKNNRMGWRGDGCTLNRLLEGYLLTGEPKFLERARWQIKSCAFDGRPARHEPTSLWSSLFYMMALARYVEMFPDDAAARAYLLAHLETLRKGTDPEHGIFYTITPQPDGSVVGQGSCSHYNIMAADALALAYRLTGRAEYLNTARECFAYGVKNACWEGGPGTYVQVHSANGALHGNLFMVTDSALRAVKTPR